MQYLLVILNYKKNGVNIQVRKLKSRMEFTESKSDFACLNMGVDRI
jgi:hypothetical protein